MALSYPVLPYIPSPLQAGVRDGSNTTSLTAYVQAAYSDAMQTGGEVIFDPGSYLLGTRVNVSFAGHVNDNSNNLVSTRGAGAGCTQIICGGAGDYAMFMQGGSVGYSAHNHVKVSGLHFRGASGSMGATGPGTVQPSEYGLAIDNGAFMHFEDVFFSNLDVGMQTSDVLSSRWLNVIWRNCRAGLNAVGMVDQSPPNALDFFGCHWGNCFDYGGRFIGGQGINVWGGSVEGCGLAGVVAERYGLQFDQCGLNVKVDGTYFELNGGQADVWIKVGATPVAAKVDGLWIRAGTTQFTTNNIRIDQPVGAGAVKLTAGGTFYGTGGYQPSPARRYIAMNCSGAFNLLDQGAIYQSPIEVPVVGTGTVASRERLDADRTYNVPAQFATPQAAIDYIIANLDLAGHTVAIQLANGVYTQPIAVAGAWTGGGKVVIQGNAAAPGLTQLSVSSTAAVNVTAVLPGPLLVKDMKISVANTGFAFEHRGVGQLQFGNIEFANCAWGHLFGGGPGAYIKAIGNYVISSGGLFHIAADELSKVEIASVTVNLVNTPNFGVAFVEAARTGLLMTQGTIWSGAATGKRYQAVDCGVVFTGTGGNTQYFPGNIAGTLALGGQYD